MNNSYDLVVVGGGINGVGIAADAASRGLSVLLCEQGDLASATSSASSKLIHGGLRYLEHFEWRLVRQSLKEREVLMSVAPHLVQAMRFQMPELYRLRSSLLIRSGLFLYDNLDRSNSLPGSKAIRIKPEDGFKKTIKKGFEYSDCWTDDARLVVTNALAAQRDGAIIMSRTRCDNAQPAQDNLGGWQVLLQDMQTQEVSRVRGQCLINATGPWVSQFNKSQLGHNSSASVRLVRGSHIVVRRRYGDGKSYLLQAKDGRVVFVIPYYDKFTLIGTTDEEYQGDPGKVVISSGEVTYLIAVVNAYFTEQISTTDIINSFSGVRPLLEDDSDNPSKVTRDYRLVLEMITPNAPLLSVFGGKLTTYRVLAKKAVNKLKPVFPGLKKSNTKRDLPGGAMDALSSYIEAIKNSHPWLPTNLLHRLVNSYGTLTLTLLKDCQRLSDLGQHFGHDLYQKEVNYLLNTEWACSAEDILWRRTKLGLVFDNTEKEILEKYVLSVK